MKQMQGLDTVFVAMERPTAPVHIGSVLIYDPSTAPGGFVRFKDILSFIEGRLHLSETMRQKMVKVPFGLDYPYWVQDSAFDIEYHVRHVALPKPGDWRQLCIQAARIFARPLDLSRPPWEVTVVEGLDNIPGVPKGAYAMITKVHHAAIDGVSGVDMMNALHTMTPDNDPPLPPDNWRPEADPSQIGMFTRGYVSNLVNPIRQAKAMRHALPGMMRTAKGLLKKEFDLKSILNTPRTRFNGTVSPHRMFDSRIFPLKDVKAIRALSEGSKLNDVIMFVPVGTHIPTARERMKYVTEETIRAKRFTNAMGARQMTEMAKLAPAPMMNVGANIYTRLKLADHIKPAINTVVTNVPGPPVPIYSTGAKLIGLHGLLCLVDGVKMGHIVHSYVDEVTLSFTACRSAIPDPDFYSECIQASFDEHMIEVKKLKSAAPKAAKKPAPKTAKAKSSRKKMTTEKTKPKAKPAAKAKSNGAAKKA